MGVLEVVKVTFGLSYCRFLDLALCAQRKNYSPCEPVQRARAVGGRLILDLGCHFRIVKFLGGNVIDLYL